VKISVVRNSDNRNKWYKHVERIEEIHILKTSELRTVRKLDRTNNWI